MTRNKADKSKKERKLELSEDETSDKSNDKKRIKREDVSNNETSLLIEKHNKELPTIKIDGNAKTKGFNFVSVKEIVEPENFEQESAITSR